jgi:hypothetical protein
MAHNENHEPSLYKDNFDQAHSQQGDLELAGLGAEVDQNLEKLRNFQARLEDWRPLALPIVLKKKSIFVGEKINFPENDFFSGIFSCIFLNGVNRGIQLFCCQRIPCSSYWFGGWTYPFYPR